MNLETFHRKLLLTGLIDELTCTYQPMEPYNRISILFDTYVINPDLLYFIKLYAKLHGFSVLLKYKQGEGMMLTIIN